MSDNPLNDAVALLPELKDFTKGYKTGDVMFLDVGRVQTIIAALEALTAALGAVVDDEWHALRNEVEALRAALRPHACNCPGECERDKDGAYAVRDMCCIAHDALKGVI